MPNTQVTHSDIPSAQLRPGHVQGAATRL